MVRKLLVIFTFTLLLAGCSVNGDNTAIDNSVITPVPRVEVEVKMTTAVPTPNPPSASPVPPIVIDGVEYSGDEATVKLTTYESLNALSKFNNLKVVDLTALGLDITQLTELKEKLPDTKFLFSIEYMGLKLDSDTTEIDIHGQTVEFEAIKTVFSLFASLTRVDMCDCGLNDEQMEMLCDRYPNIRFVWKIKLGDHIIRTDAKGFSTKNPSKYYSEKSTQEYKDAVKNTRRLYDEDIRVLKYCTDLIALDLGHNYISDISVLEYLPKLQVLILADNKLTDISVLSKLPELVYVELFMNDITDISALSGHYKLLDLNFCYNGVSDITPLIELSQLERVWASNNTILKADRQLLIDEIPNCEFNFTIYSSTDGGWREHDRYAWMRSFFQDDEG